MPHTLSGHAALDSLSNLAASLNAGRDKQAHDAFFVPLLARDQIESLYRGDWLARKIVDIVPYDCVREWRTWAGAAADVQRIEAVERALNLRRTVQRAMVMGRLYGGGALIVGTHESDTAALMTELRPMDVGRNGIAFLHAVSRWQLGVAEIERDPLSPWFGEPKAYEVTAPERGSLTLHPSRVIRFLGNPLADPLLFGADLWSDSVLTTLYDAIHAVALTTTGATSLMHEAKVDVVTVPNLSEHLSNATTTAQLSARFSYAATMKSLNNLLLLGDGETWTRQKIDFAGLPEMVRTFLQVAAGAADIPVTRLLGQSPAGLSATGDHDTRNYYDMIAARQEIELRPQLERLDRLLLASAGVAPGALSFSFRPLWQMDAAAQAAIALSKAQATQIYAGLRLWPTEVMARLVEGQLAEDGIYPNAGAVFSETVGAISPGGSPTAAFDFDPDQPRDPQGRWTSGGGGSSPAVGAPSANIPPENSNAPPSVVAQTAASTAGPNSFFQQLGPVLGVLNPIGPAQAQELDPWEKNRRLAGGSSNPTAPLTPSTEAGPQVLVGENTENKSALSNNENQEIDRLLVGAIRAVAASVSAYLAVNRGLRSIVGQAANLLTGMAPGTRGFGGKKSSQKWQNQMRSRGWTDNQIEEAIKDGKSFPENNRINPGNGATRFVHPDTGRSVVIDNTTGEVIHVGGDGFDY